MLVTVASISEIKRMAVKQALLELGEEATVRGADISSNQNAQPLGLEEIWAGAERRAEGARRVSLGSFCIGIEDGLIRINNDIRVSTYVSGIVIISPDGQKMVKTTSIGIQIPDEYAMAVAKAGFEETTVGQVIATDKGSKKADDPHFLITDGKVSICDTLVPAIKIAFLQLL